MPDDGTLALSAAARGQAGGTGLRPARHAQIAAAVGVGYKTVANNCGQIESKLG